MYIPLVLVQMAPALKNLALKNFSLTLRYPDKHLYTNSYIKMPTRQIRNEPHAK